MSWTMDQLEARAQRQLDSLNTVSERLAAIKVSETSPDGEVTAVVDGNGALIDLNFSDQVRTLNGKQLSRLIVATSGVACQKSLARRARIMQEFTESFSELVTAPAPEPPTRRPSDD